jgi:hypothetical protein
LLSSFIIAGLGGSANHAANQKGKNGPMLLRIMMSTHAATDVALARDGETMDARQGTVSTCGGKPHFP